MSKTPMGASKHIAFVCEGDAESSDKAFSGTAKSMLEHLRGMGHRVTAVNTRPSAPARAVAAALTYSRDRGVWRTRYRHGRLAHALRSARAAGALRGAGAGSADFVLQIGPGFTPPGAGRIPYALYCDWNMALSIRDSGNPHSSAHQLPLHEARRINELHARVYRGAAYVFTICERLRESFVADYGLDPDRVITAYAGPNIDPSLLPAASEAAAAGAKPAGRPPTVLFIGKEFERKGGRDLLEAFRIVRGRVQGARLLIAGPRSLAVEEPGVENLGFLSKDDPEGMRRLLAAYRDADLFCLPSLHDPFPTVVREAMFFGLPCVTTNIWAFPEMVVDGETGYTVGCHDVAGLADRMLRLLDDPALRLRMGAEGRQRAERLFTWPAATRRIHESLCAL